MIGLGIGILLCTIVLYLYAKPRMSDFYIEKKARSMGMVYPEEVKAYFENK